MSSIIKNGKVLYAKGYGSQDIAAGKPVDPATSLFRIGSTSKLFTWTAVMQLVEQGKLSLDGDVNSYLKTFKIRDAFGKPVRIRDLMTHSAGWEDGALGYLIIEDSRRCRADRDYAARSTSPIAFGRQACSHRTPTTARHSRD